MPYSYNNPPDIIVNLPEKAKKIWINAFNTAYDNNNKESTCIQIAWGAIKKAGYSKNKDNEWGRWE
ncbi:MAG: ChaB family protein [Methanogenium sp.]|jgi:cation transport regulator ChaB